MNSKLLFVGKYARNARNSKKSPKTSSKKSPNRKSKSKYEDIDLGSVMKKTNQLDSNRYNKNSINKLSTGNEALNTSNSCNIDNSLNTKSPYMLNNVSNTIPCNSRIKPGSSSTKPISSSTKPISSSTKPISSSTKPISSSTKPNNRPIQNIVNQNKLTPDKYNKSLDNRHYNMRNNQTKSRKNSSYKILNKAKSKKLTNMDKFKVVNVNANTDLYENIDTFYNPELFKHNIHQSKYYTNFPKEDRYLSTVISYGLDINKLNSV